MSLSMISGFFNKSSAEAPKTHLIPSLDQLEGDEVAKIQALAASAIAFTSQLSNNKVTIAETDQSLKNLRDGISHFETALHDSLVAVATKGQRNRVKARNFIEAISPSLQVLVNSYNDLKTPRDLAAENNIVETLETRAKRTAPKTTLSKIIKAALFIVPLVLVGKMGFDLRSHRNHGLERCAAWNDQLDRFDALNDDMLTVSMSIKDELRLPPESYEKLIEVYKDRPQDALRALFPFTYINQGFYSEGTGRALETPLGKHGMALHHLIRTTEALNPSPGSCNRKSNAHKYRKFPY